MPGFARAPDKSIGQHAFQHSTFAALDTRFDSDLPATWAAIQPCIASPMVCFQILNRWDFKVG